MPAFISRSVKTPVAAQVEYVALAHNLPITESDFFIVQFVRDVTVIDYVAVVRGVFRYPKAAINLTIPYKLIALKISNGIADGVWWHDGYVFNAGQVNIAFTSSGSVGGSEGPSKSLSGRTTINKSPVARRVFALAIEGDEPALLAETQSNENGFYTLEWNGYSGKVVVVAMDDYGVQFEQGKALGVGERVHPALPNGYVYQVSSEGVLGAEPAWLAADGAIVVSGSVVMVAHPFYRPKTAGPIDV